MEKERNKIEAEQLKSKNHQESMPNDNNKINVFTQSPSENAPSLNSIPILERPNNAHSTENKWQNLYQQQLSILDNQQQYLEKMQQQQQQQHIPSLPEQEIDLDIEQQATQHIQTQQEQSLQNKKLPAEILKKPAQQTTQEKLYPQNSKKNKKTTTYQYPHSTQAFDTTNMLIYTNQPYFHTSPCCCGLLYQDDCCCKWICDTIFHLVCLPIKIIFSILSACCCQLTTKEKAIEVIYTPFRCCGDWINQCWFSGSNFCCQRLEYFQEQMYRNVCISCWLNTCQKIGHFLQNCCLFTSKCLPNQNGFCCCQASWEYAGGICLKCGSPEDAAEQIKSICSTCAGACCCCC